MDVFDLTGEYEDESVFREEYLNRKIVDLAQCGPRMSLTEMVDRARRGVELVVELPETTVSEYLKARNDPMARTLVLTNSLTTMDGHNDETKAASSLLMGLYSTLEAPRRTKVMVDSQETVIPGTIKVRKLKEKIQTDRINLRTVDDQDMLLLNSGIMHYRNDLPWAQNEEMTTMIQLQFGGNVYLFEDFDVRGGVNCPEITVVLGTKYNHQRFRRLLLYEKSLVDKAYNDARRDPEKYDIAREVNYKFVVREKTPKGQETTLALGTSVSVCLNVKSCDVVPCKCATQIVAGHMKRYGVCLYENREVSYHKAGQPKKAFVRRRDKPRFICNRDVVYAPFFLTVHMFSSFTRKKLANYLEKKTELNNRIDRLEKVYANSDFEHLVNMEKDMQKDNTPLDMQLAIVRAMGKKITICRVCKVAYKAKEEAQHFASVGHKNAAQASKIAKRIKTLLLAENVEEDDDPTEIEQFEIDRDLAQVYLRPKDTKLRDHMFAHDAHRKIFCSMCNHERTGKDVTQSCCKIFMMPDGLCWKCLNQLNLVSDWPD